VTGASADPWRCTRCTNFSGLFWLAVLAPYWLGGREELSVNIGEEGLPAGGGLSHGISHGRILTKRLFSNTGSPQSRPGHPGY